VGGKVTLSDSAEVDGGISALGGTVVKGEKPILKGISAALKAALIV